MASPGPVLRDLPAPAGNAGSTSAVHTGALTFDPTLPTVNSRAIIDAPNAAEAIRRALTGQITATLSGQSATYPATVGTIGLATTAHLPYTLVSLSGPPAPPPPPGPPGGPPLGPPTATLEELFQLKLEDLATMPGATSDWDYDDRTWQLSAQPFTQSVWIAPGAAPAEAGVQAGWFVIRREVGAGNLTVHYGAPTGTAFPGMDYTGLGMGGGSVTFAADEWEKLVFVTPINDSLAEGAETVTLSLQPGPGYTLGTPSAGTPSSASLTIFDDETNSGSGVTAAPDTYSTVHSRQLSVTGSGVLGNDSSNSTAPLTAVFVSDVTHGALNDPDTGVPRVAANGRFLYTPEPSYVGADTFSYYVTDGVRTSPVVTVTITVTNQAPTATGDTYTTTEGGVLVGGSSGAANLLANDSDPDTESVQAVLVSNVQHGGLDLRDDGTFTYAPDANFAGTDTFTYKASDGIADSSPVTVTITVQPRTGIDLDGRDVSTNGQWKGEAEEARSGIAVSVSPGAEILARAPVAPAGSGWQLVSRQVTWDPTKLVVGGGTTGVATLSLTGDQTLAVTALSVSFADTVIAYEEAWANAGTTTLIKAEIPAKDKTATLTAIDFTSDHGVLLKGGGNRLDEVSDKAKRYADLGDEWQRALGKEEPTVNAPISHTRSEKLKMTLKWTIANIAPNTPYQVVAEISAAVGLAAPTVGFLFKSAVLNTAGGAETTAVESVQNLSKLIGKWSFDVDWYVDLNPAGPNPKTLEMGTTFGHLVYQTHDKPRGAGVSPDSPDFQKFNHHSPTVARMELAVNTFQQATINAAYSMADGNSTAALVLLASPNDLFKPARLAYQVVVMHKFNVKVTPVQPGIGQLEATWSKGWLVPATWTTEVNGKVGSNCVAGATFATVASYMVGLPGEFKTRDYTASGVTAIKAEVAIDYLALQGVEKILFDKARVRTVNGEKQYASHFMGEEDHGFIATVEYTYPTGQNKPDKSIFLPSGAPQPVVYDKKNDCITVFDNFRWAKLENGKLVATSDMPVATYTTASSIPLSKLDE